MRNAQQSSFAEIAVGLREAANLLCENVNAAEELAARLPPSPGINDSIRILRERAARVGEAHAIFKMLSELEPEMRALLETWSAKSPSVPAPARAAG